MFIHRLNTILHRSLFFFLFIIISSHSQLFPPPPPSDMNWSGISISSHGPLADGAAVSTMTPGGDVYIAGYVGSDVRVVHWNGSKWTFLGERLSREGTSTDVNAIAVAANGDVYLGGNFNRAYNGNGMPPDTTENIARWNASTQLWEKVGQGTDFSVSTIAVSGDSVLIGGPTTAFNPDGTPVNLAGIGVWNTASNLWEPVGQGVSIPPTSVEFAPNGDLYACGSFEEVFNSNGTADSVNGIARWDGSAWYSLGQGFAPSPYVPDHLSFDSSGQLFVGGYFQSAVNGNGTQVDGPVVRWDGNQWHSLNHSQQIFNMPSLVVNNAGDVFSLWNDNNFNGPFVTRWDGTQWTQIADFDGEFVPTLAANRSRQGPYVYAGGSFSSITDSSSNTTYNIRNNAEWNGTIWREMVGHGGTSGSVLALETGGVLNDEKLYVGGDFQNVSNIPANNIASYNGISWDSLGGGVNGVVRSISAGVVFKRSPLTAVGGEFTHATNPDGQSILLNNIGFWFNDAWHSLGEGVDGPVYAVLNQGDFSGTIGFYGDIIVGGNFNTAYNPDGTPVAVNSIARYNLSTEQWLSVGGGVFGGAREVRTIAPHVSDHSFLNDNYFIGGSFNGTVNPDSTMVNCDNVMLWNQDHWEALGQGVDGVVRTMAFDVINPGLLGEGVVWVGGDLQNSFNHNGTSLSTPYLSLWNRTNQQWEAIAGGVDSAVFAITPVTTAHYEGVFVGGKFTTGFYPNGNSRALNRVAAVSLSEPLPQVLPNWNPRHTTAINGPVYALEALRHICFSSGELVYAGGNFTAAGGMPARSLARWKWTWNSTIRHVTGVNHGSGSSGGIGAVVDVTPCSPLRNKASTVIFDSLGYQESVSLDSMPRHTYFEMSIFPEGMPSNPIVTYDSLMIQSALPASFVIMGVDDTTQFAPNPEGLSTKTQIVINEMPLLGAQPGEVSLLVINAVTDAPAVDIKLQGGDTIATNLAYSESASSVYLAPGSYMFDVLQSSNGQVLGSYSIDLSDNADEAVSLILSGFLDPNANQNGPPMSLDEYESGTPIVGVESDAPHPEMPKTFSLKQNYPNPFNPSTTVELEVPAGYRGPVDITIYNALGQRVKRLVSKRLPAGSHRIVWDGRNERGQRVASGIYFYGIRAGQFTQFRKMILLR